MESVETKKELKELGLVLKQFCEDKPRDSASTYDVFLQLTGSNTRDPNFMNDFRNFPASNFMTDFEIVEIENEHRRREAARAAAREQVSSEAEYFQLVFGDLKRLEYFWPHLQNKNPTFISVKYSQGQLEKHLLGYSALHILAGLGHGETFQFIAERVDEVNPTNKYGETPLDIAKKKKHFGIVQMIEDKLQNPNKRQKL